MEFLTHIAVDLPRDMTDADRANVMEAERARSAELAAAGVQKRLWRDPGTRRVWALWDAEDATALHDALSSLALWPWMTIEVHALGRHANDPANGSRPPA